MATSWGGASKSSVLLTGQKMLGDVLFGGFPNLASPVKPLNPWLSPIQNDHWILGSMEKIWENPACEEQEDHDHQHGHHQQQTAELGGPGSRKMASQKALELMNPRKKPKILVLVLCFNVFIYKAPQSPKVSKSDPPILSYSNKTRCSKQLDTASCRTCQCWMSLERSPEPPRDEVQSCSAGSRGSLRRSTSKFPSGWQDGRMLFPDFWCQFMACQNCQNCKMRCVWKWYWMVRSMFMDLFMGFMAFLLVKNGESDFLMGFSGSQPSDNPVWFITQSITGLQSLYPMCNL